MGCIKWRKPGLASLSAFILSALVGECDYLFQGHTADSLTVLNHSPKLWSKINPFPPELLLRIFYRSSGRRQQWGTDLSGVYHGFWSDGEDSTHWLHPWLKRAVCHTSQDPVTATVKHLSELYQVQDQCQWWAPNCGSQQDGDPSLDVSLPS